MDGYFSRMKGVLLESEYAGCTGWWAFIAQNTTVNIDLASHYTKASLRNRCYLMSPNGILRLSVPLEKGKHQRRPMKEVRISYDSNWQKIHWMSIVSCYRRSAYFEYYEDDIAPLFRQSPEYLHELNKLIYTKICSLLHLETGIYNLQEYIPRGEFHGIDGRDVFLNNESYLFPTYLQVFSDRHPFAPNLSIWDVLFNLGPGSKDYLLKIDLSPFCNFSRDSLL